MSQASNQITWCLNKAKKELDECKRLKKRPKHRGLLALKPSNEKAENHLKKAEENLNFANSLNMEKYGYKVVESLFYCMYQCFLAIAAKFGYESGNQTCTIALIEYLKEENKIDLDEKFIEMMKYKDDQQDKTYPSIIDMREEYTYSAKMSIEKEIIEELVLVCQKLLDKTKEIIYK